MCFSCQFWVNNDLEGNHQFKVGIRAPSREFFIVLTQVTSVSLHTEASTVPRVVPVRAIVIHALNAFFSLGWRNRLDSRPLYRKGEVRLHKRPRAKSDPLRNEAPQGKRKNKVIRLFTDSITALKYVRKQRERGASLIMLQELAPEIHELLLNCMCNILSDIPYSNLMQLFLPTPHC
jgi:hypothetical protein